jgi:hypothetical protein
MSIPRALVFALASALFAAACVGSDGGSPTADEEARAVTPIGADDRFRDFSAALFPEVDLDRRVEMAEEVCRSINARADGDVVDWLQRTTADSLVSFEVEPLVLQQFAGLAVSVGCPEHMDQLLQGLRGLPSEVDLGDIEP